MTVLSVETEPVSQPGRRAFDRQWPLDSARRSYVASGMPAVFHLYLAKCVSSKGAESVHHATVTCSSIAGVAWVRQLPLRLLSSHVVTECL